MAAKEHGRRRQRRSASGLTLIEVTITAVFLVMTSVSLAVAYGSTSGQSRDTATAVASQSSTEAVLEMLAGEPFDQLLSWNGANFDRGEHTVTVNANQVAVGLVQLEVVALDARDGSALLRVATLRSELQ